MPKFKPHSGMSKRVKKRGKKGDVSYSREQAGRRHLLEKKSSERTRRLEGTTPVAKADVKRVKKLLGD